MRLPPNAHPDLCRLLSDDDDDVRAVSASMHQFGASTAASFYEGLLHCWLVSFSMADRRVRVLQCVCVCVIEGFGVECLGIWILCVFTYFNAKRLFV